MVGVRSVGTGGGAGSAHASVSCSRASRVSAARAAMNSAPSGQMLATTSLPRDSCGEVATGGSKSPPLPPPLPGPNGAGEVYQRVPGAIADLENLLAGLHGQRALPGLARFVFARIGKRVVGVADPVIELAVVLAGGNGFGHPLNSYKDEVRFSL